MTLSIVSFLADPIAPVDPIELAVQWGVLGLVLIMLLTGWLWAKPSVEEMRRRHEEERKLWREEIIPKLDRLAAALEANERALRNEQQLFERLARGGQGRDFGTR